jgi:four helix bundle protein
MISRTKYDLEDRTLHFAKNVRRFLRRLPPSPARAVDVAQLARASGSVGANYCEANDALGRKDFLMRVRIARKEAKESRYWLQLVDVGECAELEQERGSLVDEAGQLIRILSKILLNAEGQQGRST